jgi:1-deoxy-D-xylulose-5-phosphate synthase
VVDWRCPFEEIAVGKGRCLREGTDVAVLSFGPLGVEVQKAIRDVTLSVAHYDMRFVKPLDEELLDEVGRKFKRIVTVEDGSREGGFGSAVLEWMSDHGYTPQMKRLGLPDRFVEHGTVAELQKITGIDAESIKKAVEGTTD